MDVKNDIRQWAYEMQIVKCGFAKADFVSSDAIALYDDWTKEGNHGSMKYCENYNEVRNDPRLLLEGANTIICCAFCYAQDQHSSLISDYALGLDYHFVIKERLIALGEKITAKYGGRTRAVVDTAPMRERYWAQKAGLGFIGINNQLIIPGYGSYFFLGELLWTGMAEPDSPCLQNCDGCLACVKACPGHALDGKGGCNARRCASYLTIEYRDELSDNDNLGDGIYGCDICQRVCPHNSSSLSHLRMPEFDPNEEIISLTPEILLSMTSSHYKKMVKRSAMNRAPLSQLLRNLDKKNQGRSK